MPLDGTYDVFEGTTPAGKLRVFSQGIMTNFIYECSTKRDVSRLICTDGQCAVSVGIPAPHGSGMYLKKSFSQGSLNNMNLKNISRCLLVPVNADISSYASPPPKPKSASPTPAVKPPAPVACEQVTATRDQVTAAPASAPVSAAISRDVVSVDAVSTKTGNMRGWHIVDDPCRFFSDGEFKESVRGLTGVLIREDANGTLLAFPYSPSKPFPIISAFRFGWPENIGGQSYIVYRVNGGIIV